MEEDDDAFLYGDDAKAAEHSKGAVLPEVSTKVNGETPALVNDEKEAIGIGIENREEEELDDNVDESEEEEDSDSDLEIIVDGNAGPPAGYNVRQPIQPSRAVPIQRAAPSVMTSDYTPNARPGQTSSSSTLAALTGLDSVTSTNQAESSKLDSSLQQVNNKDMMSISDLPEGPPPPVPMTAPRLDLDPPEQALMLPPETIEDEPGPLIYHIDPTEFEEKPWRKPGADLTDWFNYGFNEESWRLWGDKKYSRTMDRKEMEANGGRGGMIDEGQEEVEQDNHESSNYMSQMPQQQQIQAMQAMMGGGAAAGSTMSAEQMMAFMGMGGGGMPGMGMMGMPGMAAMFGQQNSNPFASAFPGMNNMPMMQPFQNGQIGDGSLMRFVNPTNNNNINYNIEQQNKEKSLAEEDEEEEYHPNGDSSFDQIENKKGVRNGQDEHQAQPVSREQSVVADSEPSRKLISEDHSSNFGSGAGNADNARGGMSIQGRASAGSVPTGPSSRVTSIPKGPSAERNNNASNLPDNVPTGPKHPGRRYNDRDTGMGIGDSLDYGANANYRDREESIGRSPPRHGRNKSGEMSRRDHSYSRDVSTDRDYDGERDRDYRRERERSYDDRDGHTSSKRSSNRDRTSDRKRLDPPEDGMEKLSSSRRDKKGDDRKTQRRSGGKRGDYREESYERGDEWERESVESTASRRRTSTRHQGGGEAASSNTRRTNARSERRRGGADEADSGSETERERKPGRDQKRADRRAGRDHNESSSKTSTRKRSAPEDDLSPVRSSTSRKRR